MQNITTRIPHPIVYTARSTHTYVQYIYCTVQLLCINYYCTIVNEHTTKHASNNTRILIGFNLLESVNT